jgi:hypothetical protein
MRMVLKRAPIRDLTLNAVKLAPAMRAGSVPTAFFPRGRPVKRDRDLCSSADMVQCPISWRMFSGSGTDFSLR